MALFRAQKGTWTGESDSDADRADSGPATPSKSSLDQVPRPPRWRRWMRRLLILLAIGVALVAGGLYWLDRPGPIPPLGAFCPAGGRWLGVELSRGVLDLEARSLLQESLAYLTRPHGAGGSLPHEVQSPFLQGVFFRSRPWRCCWWEGGDGSRLIVVSFGGYSGARGWVSPVEPRQRHLAAVSTWWGFSGETLFLGSRTRVQEAVASYDSVARSAVDPGARIVFNCDDPEVEGLLPLPGGDNGVTRFVGELRQVARGRWEFGYELSSTRDPGDWGMPQWRDLLEAERIRVLKATDCHPLSEALPASPEQVRSYRGAWQLLGIESAMWDLGVSFRSWREFATAPPPSRD